MNRARVYFAATAVLAIVVVQSHPVAGQLAPNEGAIPTVAAAPVPTLGELSARKDALDAQTALVRAQLQIANEHLAQSNAELERLARLYLKAAPTAEIVWTAAPDGTNTPSVKPPVPAVGPKS